MFWYVNYTLFFYQNITSKLQLHSHCVKRVHIRSFSGPCFSTFGLNTDSYGVNLRIQSECGKVRARKTPNMDTFYALSLCGT